MSNENRNPFAFGGITGALLAVVGLLLTLAVLTTMGLITQQEQSRNYYDVKAAGLTTFNDGKTSADFIVDVPAPK